jgi:hypothetical protein
MRLVQSAILFNGKVSVVGKVVDDKISPSLMSNFKMILQALKMSDILELQTDALALEICFKVIHLCLVQKLRAIVFGAKTLNYLGSFLSIILRVIGNIQIGARDRPS